MNGDDFLQSLKLKDNLYWVGALDKDLRVFDIIMETKFGTTYNSYLLLGSEKKVLFETAKEKFFDDFSSARPGGRSWKTKDRH